MNVVGILVLQGEEDVKGIGFAHSGWLGMLGLALVAFAGTRKGAGDFSLLLGLMIIIGFVGGVIQILTWLF